MIERKSSIRLQNCALCVRYSCSLSIVAAISGNFEDRATELQRYKKNLYHDPPAKLCIVEQQLLPIAGYFQCFQEIVGST